MCRNDVNYSGLSSASPSLGADIIFSSFFLLAGLKEHGYGMTDDGKLNVMWIRSSEPVIQG